MNKRLIALVVMVLVGCGKPQSPTIPASSAAVKDKTTTLPDNSVADSNLPAENQPAAVDETAVERVQTLLRGFGDAMENPSDMRRLAKQVKEVGPPAIEILVRMVQSPSSPESFGAAMMLGQFGPELEKHVPELAKSLEMKSQRDHQLIMIALAYMGPHTEAALPQLIKAAESGDQVAILAIGQMGKRGVKASPALRKLADRAELREQALVSLMYVDPRSFLEIARTDESKVNSIFGRFFGDDQSRRPPLLPTPPIDASYASELLAILQNGDETPMIRGIAGLLLGEMKHAAAVPVFVEMLKKDDEKFVALMPLTRFGPAAKTAVPALLDFIREPSNSPATEMVIRIFERIGPDAEEAIDWLTEVAKDPENDGAPEIVILALGKVGRGNDEVAQTLVNFIQNNEWQARWVVMGLMEIGPVALPHLLKLLDSPKQEAQEASIVAIGSMGAAAEEAIPKLLEIANQEKSPARGQAITTLGRIAPSDERVRTLLSKSLTDPDEMIRGSAAELIGRSAPSTADEDSLIEALRSEVADDQYSRSFQHVEAITKVGPSVIPKIVALLKDDNPNIRAAGAKVIREFGPAAKEAIPVLLDVLRKSAEKQSAAGNRFQPSPDMTSDMEIQFALSSIGPAAINPLIAQMGDDNKHYRSSLVDVLARIKPVSPSVIDVLIKSLDDDWEVQSNAINGLGEIGEPAKKAVPNLIKLLERKDRSFTTVSICECLWRIERNTEHTIPVLIESIESTARSGGKGSAIQLLSRMGPEAGQAVPALKKLLADQSKDLCVSAADALWRIEKKPDDLIPILVEILKDKSRRNSRLRPQAAKALGRMGQAAKEVVPLLVELSQSKVFEDLSVRSDAHQALRRIDPKAASGIKDPRYDTSATSPRNNRGSLVRQPVTPTETPARVLTGHAANVRAVAFSPDGKVLASAGYDGTIRIWDCESGKTLATLRGHRHIWVWSLTFSPDGRTLASGSRDTKVILWDWQTGQQQRTLSGHRSGVRGVVFSHDGQYLFSIGERELCISEINSGKLLQAVTGIGTAGGVALSPDGKTLASGEGIHITLWDVHLPDRKDESNGAQILKTRFVLEDDIGPRVWSVRFSKDGKGLVSAGTDRKIRIWDVATGKKVLALSGHERWISTVRFAPNEENLLSTSGDGTVRLWSLVTGKEMMSALGHNDRIGAMDLSPDGRLLATGSWDSTIKLWKMADLFPANDLVGGPSDNAEAMFNLLADSDEKQFSTIFDKLVAHQERAIELGNAEIARTVPSNAKEADKEALAMRQTNAAVMLLRMDAADQVWPLLKHSPDPRVRSYIIHWLAPRGGKVETIINRFEQETDVTIKRALLLCLGEFELSDAKKQPLVKKLQGVYRNDPDAGLHAAAEWLLRQWDEKLPELPNREDKLQLSNAEHSMPGDQSWYVNGQGQTFVVLEAGDFTMGSPRSERAAFQDERLHQRKIDRRFAIATKEVTHSQWQEFSNANPNIPRNPKPFFKLDGQFQDYVRSDDSPMPLITWYEAAYYCNWLSEQEGIDESQWCYEKNEDGEYGPGMKAKERFWELTGYRLPTESEWEYACRAGTSTSRYYGETETLLPQYAWYVANSDNRTHPVASLKPNDFGLFDMQGNVSEWCYNLYASYGFFNKTDLDGLTDTPPVEIKANWGRALRGDAFNTRAQYVMRKPPPRPKVTRLRSATRGGPKPEMRIISVGFRPARTYPLLDSSSR